ncbi:MAG: alpha/beta fold hydrolase, partial [Candidatus Nanopelagicales bacterium]
MSDTVARVTPAQRWTLPRGEIVVRARQADPRRDVEAAVFVHGLGGSTLNWVSLVAELDDNLDWVSVDLPGFGGSPPPRDGDYSPRGHARAVIGVIEEVQRRRGLSAPIHLVGNSLGGAVALQVTAARPDLVAGLTLVSPALPDLTLGRGNAHLPVVALPGVGESLVG